MMLSRQETDVTVGGSHRREGEAAGVDKTRGGQGGAPGRVLKFGQARGQGLGLVGRVKKRGIRSHLAARRDVRADDRSATGLRLGQRPSETFRPRGETEGMAAGVKGGESFVGGPGDDLQAVAHAEFAGECIVGRIQLRTGEDQASVPASRAAQGEGTEEARLVFAGLV